MLLSDMPPKVRKSRDKLAREIYSRKGGTYLAAVTEANRVIRGAIAQAQGRVTETLTAAGLTSSMTQAPAAAQPEPAADPFASLHTLDHDTASTAMEAALGSYGQAAGFGSPFWRGL